MKKILYSILVVCLILSVVSCGDKKEESSKYTPTVSFKNKYAEEIEKSKNDSIAKYPKLEKRINKLFEKYDYAEILNCDYDFGGVMARVSIGGEFVNGHYEGGKWGTNTDNSLIYDYVGNFVYTELWFDQEQGMEPYYMYEVSNGGTFDEKGNYIGKFGVFGEEDARNSNKGSELLLPMEFGFISEVGSHSAVVANYGNRTKDGNYLNGKYGIVEYHTGKVLVPIKYDYIYALEWLDKDMDYFESPYAQCSLGGKVGKDGIYEGGKWGIVDVRTAEEVLPIEYDYDEMNKVENRLKNEWLEIECTRE